MARRLAPDGTPVSAEFQVDTYPAKARSSSVAFTASGDFVVTWSSDGSPGTDQDLQSIQARRFGADGAPAGPQFQVNRCTTSSQEVFASDGSAQGPQFQVNSTDYEQSMPAAVATPGGFLAAWMSGAALDPEDDLWRIHARRFALPVIVPALGPVGGLACALFLLGVGFAVRHRSVR